MKNIHVLPTDKPSRLHLWTDENGSKLALCDLEFSHTRNTQNIYITCDEEIKEGDWCYYLNKLGGGNSLCQAYKHSEDKRMLFDNGTHNREIGEGITPLIGECKKIILTTDQDLIKDGVQAINDNFLEWFVKNPSCEFVEVEHSYVAIKVGKPSPKVYKIIIPKEEQKKHLIDMMQEDEKLGLYDVFNDKKRQGVKELIDKHKQETPKTFKELFSNTGIEPTTDENGNTHYNFKATMKQETIEEAADKWVFETNGYKWSNNDGTAGDNFGSFIAGFKACEEQNKNKYSEEEVLSILYKHTEDLLAGKKITLEEWFEQFKKK